MDITKMTISELEELSIDGDRDAAEELIRRYREGDGVEKNEETAKRWSALFDDEIPGEDLERETVNDTGMEAVSESSWSEQYEATSRKIIGRLRKEAEEGNTVAMIVLAEKYLASNHKAEIEEGLRLLDQAEGVLRSDLTDEASSASREALVHLFNTKGQKLEERYRETRDPSMGEKAFNAYSNAQELDPAQVAGIARCYREGIGVEKNEAKARDYEAQHAMRGGIEEKYRVGKDAYESGERMHATEWFQSALLAEDADAYPALKQFIRVMLGRMGETDEQGNAMDAGHELERLSVMANSDHDPEAVKYWGILQEEREKETSVRRTKECLFCGAQIAENANFCKYCGKSQTEPADTEKPAARGTDPYGRTGRYGGVDYGSGYTGDEPVPPAPASGESKLSKKQIVTAVVLAVCVLAVIGYAVSLFMNHDRSENDVSSQQPATEQATPESDPVQPEVEQDEYLDDDLDEPDMSDERSYNSYSHAELYDLDTPMFFPDSDARLLSEDELVGLTWDQLQKINNDIYARHGLIFKSDGCKDYYPAQDWAYAYTDDRDEVRANMNDYERKNIDMISIVQKRIKDASAD